jgi:uncharacterized protein with PIN domain
LSYFFDTSALVKIYHQEDNSDKIVGIFNSGAKIFVSELSVIEYHSVIHRKFREKNLEKADADKILKKFDIDLAGKFELLVFNWSVIDNAKKVFQTLDREIFVRALDVIQLGFFKSYLNDSDIFMTFDSRQSSAIEKLKEKNFFTTNNKENVTDERI